MNNIQKRTKQMQRYFMSKYRKAQHCQDVNSLQLTLYIQCNLNQSPNIISWIVTNYSYEQARDSE